MPEAQTAPAQSRKRVLLIEDESAIRTVVTEILRREGFDVIEASAGQAGIRTAVSREPDIILLDWVLPDISGLDVCREIRRQGVLCPVLMPTGRTSKVDMVVGLEVGADDYMTKPFNPRELVARQHQPAVVEELPQQVELLRRELHLDAVDRRLTAAGIDAKIAVRDHLGLELAALG